MDDGVEISEIVHTISRSPIRTGPIYPAELVAVTYRQTTSNLTLYYSANCPNPNRRGHIEEIADTICGIVPNQRVKTPTITILSSCLEACSRKIKQRIRKLCKAYTDVVYWDMHKDNLENSVQSICRPGADNQKAHLFFHASPTSHR